jgi:hypothetical protein
MLKREPSRRFTLAGLALSALLALLTVAPVGETGVTARAQELSLPQRALARSRTDASPVGRLVLERRPSVSAPENIPIMVTSDFAEIPRHAKSSGPQKRSEDAWLS